MTRALTIAVLLLMWAGSPAADDGAETPAKVPAAPAPFDAAALDRSIERGVQYLLNAQNRDGSWGTPASNLHDIYAPVPGSQQAFHVASTALAVSGLIASRSKDPLARAAIEKAGAWLIRKHGVKRVSPNTLYNTWAHAYAMEAFARLLEHETDEARRKPLLEAAALALERLETFEFVEGGWGYYDFQERARNPGRGATSFTTAAALHALKAAADQGLDVPRALVEKALGVIRITRRPDNAYAYAVKHRFYPQMGVNKVKGSLARTPACLRALLDWSRDAKERKKAETGCVKALEDLETYGHFLLIARKYPIPHETWYQNSGYFCFYGYYYAAEILDAVPASKRRVFANQIQGRLVGLQEQDGSFWDYQLFSFHKAYGTGYVLATLSRCRDVLAEAQPSKAAASEKR